MEKYPASFFVPHDSFGNLKSLRVYQPEFGTEPVMMELLRHNLAHNLSEVACVARHSSQPFLTVLKELDVDPPPPSLTSLAAAQVVECTSTTASSLEARGYPSPVVAAVVRAEERRETSLWFRGREGPVMEAVDTLGEAIARNHNMPHGGRSFLGHLVALKIDLTFWSEHLEVFRTKVISKLRNERLGSDSHLGLRIEIQGKRAPPENEGGLLMCLIDVIPLTIGLETVRGLFLPVMRRNTTIPSLKSMRLRWEGNDGSTGFLPELGRLSSSVNSQSIKPQRLRIFAGERTFAADNIFLGEVEIPVGEAPMDVLFDVDANDRLSVNGMLCGAHGTGTSRFSHETIEMHIRDAKAFKEEDEMRQAAVFNDLAHSEALHAAFTSGS
jgi:hypothetical protein